ncbi:MULTISPECIES: putative hemolysin [Vibrio]|uniref:DUF333 domain-containing protein n=1 Tax=Vibrio kanaloae TaxID=170673 RepID=A0ABV4LCX3_9VIBR|nr:DUF333 domain-containing protein [Vibrio kanaloae]OEF15637.1 hemolysin [Vibrio kanaloae 5S-149]
MKKIGLMAVFALVLGGCANDYAEYSEVQRVSVANPASVYCVQQDGELDTVTENNQRTTYCVLQDGQRIEQWEYYRNNHDQKENS